MSETISINLWDDYYEDGYIPAGERQETHMYVEAYEGNDKEGDCKKKKNRKGWIDGDTCMYEP